MFFRLLTIFSILLSLTNILRAQSNTEASTYMKVTRPGALFLLIPPDARTSGMGNIGSATNPDLTTVFYNAAKMPYIPNNVGIHVSYTPWFTSVSSSYNSMYLMNMGGYYKFNQTRNKITIGSSIRYLNYGTATEVLNGFFEQSYKIRPYEIAADLSAGIIVTKGLSIGLSTRYVRSDVIGLKQNGFKAANTFLGDFSIFYEKNLNYTKNDENANTPDYYDLGYDKIFLTLLLSNLGGKFNYQSTLIYPELPPTNLVMGIGYRRIFNESNMLILSGEINKLLVPIVPKDNKELQAYYERGVISSWVSSFKNGMSGMVAKIGSEYWYNDLLAIRIGGFHEFQENGLTAITFGSSIKYQYASFDLSYFLPIITRISIYNPLANTLRFGMSLYFK